jgi:hypothetical protein
VKVGLFNPQYQYFSPANLFALTAFPISTHEKEMKQLWSF